MSETKIDIDVKGKMCPIPLVRLEKALRNLASGDVLSITGDDPTFRNTIKDHCNEKGLEIIDVTEHDDSTSITIKIT